MGIRIIEEILPDLLSRKGLEVFIENDWLLLLAGQEVRAECFDGGGVGVQDVALLVKDDDDFRGVVEQELVSFLPFLQGLLQIFR